MNHMNINDLTQTLLLVNNAKNADDFYDLARRFIENTTILNTLKSRKNEELSNIFNCAILSNKSYQPQNITLTIKIFQELFSLDNTDKAKKKRMFAQYIYSFRDKELSTLHHMIYKLFHAKEEQHFLCYYLYEHNSSEMIEYTKKEFIHFSDNDRKTYISHLLNDEENGGAVVDILYHNMGAQYVQENLYLYLEGHSFTQIIGEKFIEYDLDISITRREIINMTAFPEEIAIIDNTLWRQQALKEIKHVQQHLSAPTQFSAPHKI